MDMTLQTWDPEQHPRAPWQHGAVATILNGVERTGGYSVTLRHKHTDHIHSFHGVRFSCGCAADDYDGWQSCDARLHAFLAARDPGSPAVIRYRALRTVFDSVLAEAWRRHGQEQTAYAEFDDDRRRKPFLRFDAWQMTHDLCGHSVWRRDGGLAAHLDYTPIDDQITLHQVNRDTLGLELIRDFSWYGLSDNLRIALQEVFGAPSSLGG